MKFTLLVLLACAAVAQAGNNYSRFPPRCVFEESVGVRGREDGWDAQSLCGFHPACSKPWSANWAWSRAHGARKAGTGA